LTKLTINLKTLFNYSANLNLKVEDGGSPFLS